ncbi:MAG: hypothetical protein LBN95_00095 [Prevotellaceae bacterium]|jgi:3-phosphoshikimate 1-carboxyvinyltransferase|nr:hypothetical protein [Prevotellaceae bacterium]
MAKPEIKINLPTSKSIVNRLLIIEALSGKKILENSEISCDDTNVLSQALLKSESQKVNKSESRKVGKSDLQTDRLSDLQTEINAGLSGTAMRFLTAFLAQKSGEWILTGEKPLLLRPIGELVDLLRTLGAEIYYLEKEGFLPLKIVGKKLVGVGRVGAGRALPLRDQPLQCSQLVSSQTISALMLIAPMLENGLKIEFQNISSFSYILLTKKIMEMCGVKIECHCGLDPQSNENCLKAIAGQACNDNNICISVFPQKYFPQKILIEADWSAAAFWYAFLAISNEKQITLNNLFPDSYQPDSVVKDIFKYFGIKYEFSENNLIITKNTGTQITQIFTEKICVNPFNLRHLRSKRIFKYNFKNCPDLVPALAVTCCAKGVKFIFSGVKNLKFKESNRLQALCNELQKCGFAVKNSSDFLFWNGSPPAPLKGVKPQSPIKINTHNDHRIAMAFGILSRVIDLEIINPQVVEKSYRGFWKNLPKKAHR